jgi:hypothetical protein
MVKKKYKKNGLRMVESLLTFLCHTISPDMSQCPFTIDYLMSYVKITNVSIKNIRQRIYKNKIKSK